jgi:aldehyde:ferredoxin oxidoreductase
MESFLLRIDLSNRSCEVEEIPETIIKKYVGGRGPGSCLLYRLVPAHADPPTYLVRRLEIER